MNVICLLSLVALSLSLVALSLTFVSLITLYLGHSVSWCVPPQVYPTWDSVLPGLG